MRAFDIRARLCGVRVNFFRDQLMGSVWYLGSKAHLDVGVAAFITGGVN